MKRILALTSILVVHGFWIAASLADVDPSTSSSQSNQKKVVAVLPFSSPTEYSVMGRNAQETFVTHLVKSGSVRVIQATMVDRMLRRYGLHYTGTIDPAMLKAAGQWLKADYLLAGKIRYGGDAYILSAHVANVKTLETTMAEDVDFRDVTKMRIAVRALASKIAGSVSGRGGSDSGSKAGLFLNIDPRAFYDTADAGIRAMQYVVRRFSFSGTVEEVDTDSKTVKVKGYAGNLELGVPLDIYSTSGIDEPTKLTTAYLMKKGSGGFEARYAIEPSDGIELGAKITTHKHKWTVAVGKIEDEVEEHEGLVNKFRSALLDKMSEGEFFQQVEGGATDILAKLSNRSTRSAAFKMLFNRGVDLVLEGKFYGSAGSRRAHFKVYSTLTGKVLGEPKFETSL